MDSKFSKGNNDFPEIVTGCDGWRDKLGQLYVKKYERLQVMM